MGDDPARSIYFQGHPEPLLVFGRDDLRILDANEAAASFYGYSHEELLALTVADLRPAEDLQALAGMLARHETGKVMTNVTRHRLKSGRLVDVDVQAFAFERDGRPMTLASVRPGSSAIEQVASLRTAERLLRLGTFRLALHSRLLRLSDSASGMLGLEPGFQAPVDEFLRHVPAADRLRLLADLDAFVASADPFLHFTCQFQCADGRLVMLSAVGERVPAAPEPLLVGALRDATDELRASEALRAALAQNQAILHSTIEAICGVDPAGRVLFANASARRMLRLAAGAELGNVEALLRGERQGVGSSVAASRAIRQTLLDGQARQGEGELVVGDDGAHLSIDYSVVPLHSTDGATGAVVTLRDVTQRRQALALRELESRVLEMIGAGSPLSEILDAITTAADALRPGLLSSVALVEQGHLRHGAAPHLPPAYNQGVNGLPVAEGMGSCGTAAARGQQVIVTDIATDPLWAAGRDVALSFGLGACWSTPVKDAKGEVIATFAMYFRQPRSPAPEDQDFIVRTAQFVRIAIERTRLHERLMQSEQRHRELFQSIPVPTWEADWSGFIQMLREQDVTPRGDPKAWQAWTAMNPQVIAAAQATVRVVEVNQAALNLFGARNRYEFERALPTLFGTAEAERDTPSLFAAIASGATHFQHELAMRTLDGRMVQVLSNVVVPRNTGSPGHVLNSLLDITARKEAEDRFRAVAQATSDVLWDRNLRTGEIWFSSGMARSFGYDPHGFGPSGMNWESYVHPEDRPGLTERLRRVLSSGESQWDDEYRLVRADGSIANVAVRGVVLRDEAGEPFRTVGSIVDETEKRLMEERLRQSQRLDAIGHLTGGVAHDFNNLLTVIMGSAEALSEEIPPEARQRPLVDLTLKAAQRGADLTRRLLTFARRQPLAPRSTDVNHLLEGMVELLRRSLGENIRLETEPAPSLWDAMVDPAQLESGVLNLCINARDAMPRGGRLLIRTENVDLRDWDLRHELDLVPGQYVMIGVSDSGTGMDGATLKRAFEPFFTTKEVGKGSGLGLSMVYGFAKQSRGTVHLWSAPGAGTVARIFLPRAGEPTEREEIEAVGRMPRGRGESVLLVEDDALVREHASALLLDLGYQVVAVGDGEAALSRLQGAEPVELLFSDIVMPGGIDGWKLAGLSRRLRPALPILLTSGYNSGPAMDDERELEHGAELLRKPYRKQELAEALRRTLDRRTAGHA